MMIIVALLARAWIEIFDELLGYLNYFVALLARAWIEIIRVEFFQAVIQTVALLARAWIEITFPLMTWVFPLLSLSLRERGLKY